MGSRNSPFAGRGRATMLMVETSPARLGNVKASLKRSIDRDSLLVQEAGKVKKPRYAGTIYEAMLARLLVRFGADTRLSSRDGWSPVHMASFSGNTTLLLFLLSCRS